MNKILFDIFLSIIIGSIIVIAIPYIIHGSDIIQYHSPLFPFVTTAIKNSSFIITSACLFVTFAVIGYLRKTWLVLGFSSILIFPLITISEILNTPSSHNLWPFELLFYLSLMIFSLVGAFTGNKIAQSQKKVREDKGHP